MNPRILVVDDDQAMCDFLEAGLKRLGYDVGWVLSAREALERLLTEEFDVILSDVRMGGMSGLELCADVHRRRPDVPVVVLTAFGSLEAAVTAIRAGAYDFVSKPVELEALDLVLRRAFRHRELVREVQRLRREPVDPSPIPGIIGESAAMRQMFDLLARTAQTDVPVLLTGETGTGKELVARALHGLSPRPGGPFLALNCAAVPETLLESEMFGFVRGAFTDASHSHDGLLVQARGGTMFLDEIGDLPPALQPKLLRVLQERRIRPIGGSGEVEIDCRVITATNRDLRIAVENGRFRHDLYYRLDVIQIPLPPLRVRAGDILLLAQHFLERAARRTGRPVVGLTRPVARALLDHSWPGNVRELENCIERAVALTDHDHLVLEDLPVEIRENRTRASRDRYENSRQWLSLEELERQHIRDVMQSVKGNKSLAAKILGVTRRTLYRKLEGIAGDGASPGEPDP